MTRLVQLRHPSTGRRVAVVVGPELVLVNAASVYELAQSALRTGRSTIETVRANLSHETISYDAAYSGASEWRILPCFHHPDDPARCLVSGTGLTHKGSAENRHAMHAAAEADLTNNPAPATELIGNAAPLTDSIRMFRWGLEGGRPDAGQIGVAPEWFYKGCGTILRGDGEPLVVPEFGEDGGEEAEIAGVYIIDDAGQPRRIGMTVGNEFSDHRTERRNYLYLAHSKMRTCSIGPELALDPDFKLVHGVVTIERNGQRIWSKEIVSGEGAMCHSLANIEHHHFKYDAHRRPGDAHIHFFGADSLSFGDGIELQDGDVMLVAFKGFGRALRNPVRIERHEQNLVTVSKI
jgi:hypothetical protein